MSNEQTSKLPAVISPVANREAWLEQRKQGIGASEAAAVLGVSPWLTPLELFMRKSGLIPEQEQTQLMRFGLMWEQFLYHVYAEDSGRAIFWKQEFCRHPNVPFMFATLDARAADRVVELKKVSTWAARDFGPSGTDDIPIHYRIQVQQQMACSGLPLADLGALIGDDDFRIYTIERDDALIAKLIDAEAVFWQRVQANDPPLPDYSHPTTLEVLRMIEPHAGELVRLGDDAVALANAYEALGEHEKLTKAARDEAKARLIHAMGTAGIAILPDGRRIERKSVTRRAHEVAESTFFSFSIKHPKPPKELADGQARIEGDSHSIASEAPCLSEVN